ncbi:MAG: hypothetical protein DME26_06930, partial [Verrucomicrobia bacterium]
LRRAALLSGDCVVSGFVGVTCQVIADSEDLNCNASRSTVGQSANSFDTADNFMPYSIQISGLTGADTYTIGFNAVSSTLIEAAAPVPEPGSMGLVGAALAGLGFAMRRRKTQA